MCFADMAENSEFGHFTFSKNTSTSVHTSKPFSIGLHCYEDKALESGPVCNGTSTRYLLPKQYF